jgi:outer membrane protein insertion porin family
MKRDIGALETLVLALFLGVLPSLLSGQEIVEKIEISGNERVTRETILYYLTAKEGDGYDEAALRRDFRVLWSTGFFSNIRIEAEEGDKGKRVLIFVEENPVVKDVVFRTGKRIKENDIVNKLKEKDEYLLPYSYFSPSKVRKIEGTIETMLTEKGLSGGDVTADIARKGENEVGIVFRIKEGSRIRVGEISFEGSPGLHKDLLVGAMKENKKHDLLTWMAGKDIFKEDKLNENLASLKKILQENGYMEASIGEPMISDTTKRSIFLKRQKMKTITIPIWAGERYVVGDVNIEGNKLISAENLRSLAKFKAGAYYSAKAREKALEKIGEIYRNIGYLYVQIIPVESLDPKGKRVNISFTISEGEPTYLSRLEFKGNTFTKDKVIRREFLLREGDRFSLALFKDSLLRVKQLGIVDVEKQPEIKPDAEDPSKIDVIVSVKELQKNNIQFSAGYSGYEGTFIAVGYSTVNLLGTGESLDVTAQYGKRIKNYSLGFTEPYVFDLPLSAGFTIYDRSIYYPYLFRQESRGISYSLGMRVKGFWRTNITYGFEYLDVGPPDTEEDETSAVYSPYYYGGTYGYGNYFVGSLSTFIYRNTVDSPLTPSRGTLYSIGCKFSGGPLGGEVDLIKPQLEWTYYRPIVGRSVLGFHLEYQFLKPLGSRSVPFWERFYLGGERSIRGYEIYTVGPHTSEGVNKGGEKALVFNAEYIIPVGGPLYAIFFCDAGNAFARREKVRLTDLYSSTGLEMRIFVPALRVPFRLIFAYNNRKITSVDSHFAFRFAIGTTF